MDGTAFTKLRSEDQRQPGDFEIATMDGSGDKKEMWNPANPDEVESARKTFNDLRAKNYLAFRIDKDGNQGEQMREFDPQASKMLMVPQFQGG